MTDLSRFLPGYVSGLVIGTAGGAAFYALGLPLPWMLGALFCTMIAAVAGLPVEGPARWRPVVVAVIGVLLGARFAPEVLGQIASWGATLGLLLAYLLVVGLLNAPYHRFVAGYDWRTSYFAGMPGGLAEMIEFAEEKKCNVEQVVLAHSLRVVVTIAMIAFYFRIVLGHDVGAGAGGSAAELTLTEAGLLLLAGVSGCLIGKLLHWPAPTFLGPMAVSAALHLTGVSAAAPPDLLVNGAQVILGTVLGCRFLGVPLRALGRAGLVSIGSTLLMLGAALGFAALTSWLTGVDSMQVLLALAPGGLTEMGLIALAINADVAFVALHHVVRILLVILAAPLVFRIFDRGAKG